MGVSSDLFEVNIIGKLHVLGVDTKDLKPTSRVRDTDVNLSVEPTESTKGGINRVGPIGGCHHDDVRSRLQTVHQSKELGDDSPLDFTVRLFSLRSNRVKFVDEDNRRAVLLGLFKSFSEVGFGLARHLRHDLGTVDKEEEGTGLVGDSSGHEGLTGTRRTIHEDTPRRLDTDGLEELRVSQRKLNKFSDLKPQSVNMHRMIMLSHLPEQAASYIHQDRRNQHH